MKKSGYIGAIIAAFVLLVIILVIAYVTPDSGKKISFAIGAEQRWYFCWDDDSNVEVFYDFSSDLPVDLMFTPEKSDIVNLDENSKHYPSCYSPGSTGKKGSCVIAGTGCMVFLNKQEKEVNLNLKYSAKSV